MKKATVVLIALAVFFTVLHESASAQRFGRNRFRQARTQGTAAMKASPMKIEKAEFGKTADGKIVDIYKLDNGRGVTVEVLSYGGVIYTFNVPDKDGKVTNVSANYETVAEYEKNRPFFGSLVGRYGNRIGGAKFKLDGKEYTLPKNNGPNSLHGGVKGFDTKVWNVKEIKGADFIGLELTYTSADGEEGFPGKMDVTVRYKLDNKNRWTMDYTAVTDKPTVVNLTNHTFWNLAGFPAGKAATNHDHVLMLNADKFLPTDNTLIPTGELKAVNGTEMDFRKPRRIGERIGEVKGAHFAGGYDHCYVLNQKKKDELTLCADILEPGSGRTMKIYTTEPAVQFYAGNFLNGKTGAFGHKYEKQSCFCLETQHYPDSPNKPAFPSTVLRPGETFRSTTIHHFGVKR